MSIASRSVLGRILDDVRGDPGRDDPLRVQDARDGSQLLRLGHSDRVGAPPFSTTFHFWGRFMRDVLEREGRVDAFDALVGNGLCDLRDGAEFEFALAALGTGAGLALDPTPQIGAIASYRMIDEPEMVSWVAEGRGEAWAFVWARAPWLQVATPIVRD